MRAAVWLGIVAAAGCARDRLAATGTGADAAAEVDGPVAPDASIGREAGPDGASAVYTPTDGTRLEARWMEGPDGTRTLWGWYDTQLKAPCRFELAADDAIRCLPEGPIVERTWFADAACKVPAIVRPWRACEADDAFAVAIDSTVACHTRRHLYRIDGRVAGNQTYEATFTCDAVVQPATSVVFRVGAEVPAEMFVAASPTVLPATAGDDAQLVILKADDGATQDWGWRDRRSGRACGLSTLTDHQLHCVPDVPWSGRVYADAACTTPLASFYDGCGASEVILQRQPGACTSVSQAHEVGGPVDGGFTSLANRCAPRPAGQTTPAHTIGAALPDDRFPRMSITGEPSDHRLVRQRLTSPGGQAVTWSWFDTRLREPCFPLLYQGQRLCVPSSYQTFKDTYADAACTKPLWRGSRQLCQPRYVDGVDHAHCPQQRILFAVGAPYLGPVYDLVLVRENGVGRFGCYPATISADDVFNELAAIPDADLAALKLIEPL